MLMKFWAALRGHVAEHVAKYAVAATGVLTPLAGLLGLVAADIGGTTPVGHALLGASAAIGTAIAGILYVKNLGVWQMLDKFGVAPGLSAAAAVKATPVPGFVVSPAPSNTGSASVYVLNQKPPAPPADPPSDGPVAA